MTANYNGALVYPLVTGQDNLDKRIVFSPHIVGPSLSNDPIYADANFPRNLDAAWDTNFGWIKTTTQGAVVYGEIGGTLTGNDKVVLTSLQGGWVGGWVRHVVVVVLAYYQ